VRYGGNTSCVEVEVGGHILILDAGTGIIGLGNELLRRAAREEQLEEQPQGREGLGNPWPLQVGLLITHGHGDHLIGLPFFNLLYEKRADIHFFGPGLAGRTIEQLVTPIMSPPYFPVDMRKLPSHRTFHTLANGEQIIWRCGDTEPTVHDGEIDAREAEVRVMAILTDSHPLDGAVSYRIEYAGRSLVFATDVEWKEQQYDPDFIAFVEGADLLIHDAQYTNEDYQQAKTGFGHSTIEMATDMARAAGVGKLVLFHHDPGYNDDKLDAMQAEAQARFTNTHTASEGMEIDLLTE
jgi:ribonuclease BN (tRNA processing enzyme)